MMVTRAEAALLGKSSAATQEPAPQLGPLAQAAVGRLEPLELPEQVPLELLVLELLVRILAARVRLAAMRQLELPGQPEVAKQVRLERLETQALPVLALPARAWPAQGTRAMQEPQAIWAPLAALAAPSKN